MQVRSEMLKAADSPGFDALEAARRDTATYLRDYVKIESLREQTRDVYQIGETLKKYPQTRLAYAESLLARDKVDAAWREVADATKFSAKEVGPRLLLINRIVESEYYANAERARVLTREVKDVLSRAATRPELATGVVLAQLEQIERNLRGLEDYLTAKQLVNVEKNYAQAIVHAMKAVEQGSPMAMATMGILHTDGRGVPRDQKAARQWFEKAVAAGTSSLAEEWLGRLHASDDVSNAYALARPWYEKAVAQGSAWAMVGLGNLYYRGGKGVTQDDAKARELFQRAAEKNWSPGAYNLALTYIHGNGIAKDVRTGLEWMTRAANLGDVSAMHYLGLTYYEGKEVPKDYESARKWFQRAADKGDAAAMHGVGIMFHRGEGGEQDESAAAHWYQKAAGAFRTDAERGSVEAMEWLAKYYATGAPESNAIPVLHASGRKRPRPNVPRLRPERRRLRPPATAKWPTIDWRERGARTPQAPAVFRSLGDRKDICGG